MNEIDKIWSKLKKDWMKSQAISDGSYKLYQLVNRYPKLENFFFEALKDENRYLVSNCFVGLNMMESTKIQFIPKELFERDEKITLVIGSFSFPYTIKKLAKEISMKCVNRIEQKNADMW